MFSKQKGLVQFSTPRLKTFWRYAKVEFKPPVSEIPEVTNGLSNLLASAKSGKWKQLTVKVMRCLITFFCCLF
jgi:F-type H+-transporting ATPase subunit g